MSIYRILDWEHAVELILEHIIVDASVGVDGVGIGGFGSILDGGVPTNDYYHECKCVDGRVWLRDDNDGAVYECWREVDKDEYDDFVDEWDVDVLSEFGFSMDTVISL